MPTVDLELQLAFLNQLNEALDEALVRHKDEPKTKLNELTSMKSEVRKARVTVAAKLSINEAMETTPAEYSNSPVTMAGA